MATFKEKLAGTGRLTCHICTIPSAVVTQAIAAAGADCVTIDWEHGAIDHATAQAMIAATAGTDCSPWVRIAEKTEAQVKRALDLGAEGIMFPLIRDAAEAEWAVRSLRYPPEGTRSFGPFIAHSRYRQDMMTYARSFGARAICCILAETVEAVENIEAICAVPGIDLLVPAPFDLSTSLGIPGQFDDPRFKAAVAKIEAAGKAAGLPLGGVALTEAQARGHFDRGYRIVAGFDVLWLKARAAEAQQWCEQ